MHVTRINAAGQIYRWGAEGIDRGASQTLLGSCSQAGTGPGYNLASTAQKWKGAAFLSSGFIPSTPHHSVPLEYFSCTKDFDGHNLASTAAPAGSKLGAKL